MTRLGPILGCAALLTLAGTAAAQSESRVSADASVTAGYSNNPFTLPGGGTGAGVVTLDLSPTYQLLTPRSTITVTADANLQQYLSKYGRNDSYSGVVDYQGRPSEHTTTHLALNLSSAVLGAYNNYLPVAALTPITTDPTGGAGAVGTGVIQPVTAISPLVPYTDVGLYGTRTRRQAAGATGDVSFTLSTRDTATITGYAQLSRYDDDGNVGALYSGDYEAFGGSVGWQRRLSSRLSAGLTGSASTYNYHGGQPDTQVGTVQATATFQLNERWSGDGAIGVSFVSGGNALSTNSTSVSGNLDLCRRGPYSQLCVQAGRQVSPTGFAGSQYITSAGLSWNRRLDERQNVSLAGSYSKVGGDVRPIGGIDPFENEYVQATAGYNRRLGTRLSFVASANYRKLLGDQQNRTSDYGGQVGLSYHLGDRR